MLHTTLHNEAENIQRRYQNSSFKDDIRIKNSNKRNKIHFQEHYDQNETESNQTGRKFFDMITPNLSDDLLLWPKAGNYVVSTESMSSYAISFELLFYLLKANFFVCVFSSKSFIL